MCVWGGGGGGGGGCVCTELLPASFNTVNVINVEKHVISSQGVERF